MLLKLKTDLRLDFKGRTHGKPGETYSDGISESLWIGKILWTFKKKVKLLLKMKKIILLYVKISQCFMPENSDN